MDPEKRRKAEQIICNFLMENKGKAFTSFSLNKRCLELQELDLKIDDIVRVSQSLYSLGKIGMEVKENEAFYYIPNGIKQDSTVPVMNLMKKKQPSSSVDNSTEKEDDITIEMDKREKHALETTFLHFKGSKLVKSQTAPLSAMKMGDIVILTSKYKLQTVLALFIGFILISLAFLAFFSLPSIDDERAYGLGLTASGVRIVLILLFVPFLGVGGWLIIFALKLRHYFIVLHYRGIYYKRIGKPKFIAWVDIDRIVGYLRYVRGRPTERAVKIHLISNKRVRFNSSDYLFKYKFFDFDDVFYSYKFRQCPFYSMDSMESRYMRF